MIVVLAASLPLFCFGEQDGADAAAADGEVLEELRRLVFVERKNPPKTVPGVTQVPSNLFAQPNAFNRAVQVPRAVPVPRADPFQPRALPPAPQPRRVQAPPRVLHDFPPDMIERLQPRVMDRLRRGQAPLPIPLTAESIETLTKEGIDIPKYLRPVP